MDMTRFRELLRQGVADPHFAACYHKKDSEAPDYTPVANASVEAAQISDRLGRDQMAQAKQLHDESMTVVKPVLEAQLGLMKQTQQQGDDYYNYMVRNQRPVEAALNQEAMGYNGAQDAAERGAIQARLQQNDAANAAERGLITGSNTAVYDANAGDIENDVGRAVADARTGQTATTNMMIRQAARYGWSPEKLAAMAGAQGLGMASQQAAAANSTRNAGIDQARTRLAQAYDMRNANDQQAVNGMMSVRGLRQADAATAWGKKMDVAGLYRNMVGASQGAYGLALGAGNNAVSNQMAPGNAMMAQNQGAMGTIMQGQNIKVQGLSNALNAQTSAYNSDAGGGAGMGQAIGAVAGIAATAI